MRKNCFITSKIESVFNKFPSNNNDCIYNDSVNSIFITISKVNMLKNPLFEKRCEKYNLTGKHYLFHEGEK